MRDNTRLALAIAQGIIKIDRDTPCTTDGCTNPLLSPVAFNPLSRIDSEYVCDPCDAWEKIHNTKCPTTGATT